MFRTKQARYLTIGLAVVAASVVGAPEAFADLSSGTAGVETPMVAGPEQFDHGQAATFAKHHPGSVPLGVNDFGCRPSAAHPYPVVLAHGTDSNSYSDWAGVAPLLVRDGYCVFAVNYGGRVGVSSFGASNFGTEDMASSAAQVGAFTDRVLRATGASKVDFVGYSQGATITREYISRLGGAPKTHRWVGLASPTYGGTLYGLVPVAQAIPGLAGVAEGLLSTAVVEQMQDSPFLRALNAGGDTVPGIGYTTIGSRVDEMIQPYTNMALRSPGATNIVIQDLCPIDQSGHFKLPYDRFAQRLVVNALATGVVQAPRCEPVPLGDGIPSVIWSAHS